jgi:hypothetical protein
VKIIELPVPLEGWLYHDAVARYACAVHDRSAAVYLIGNVSYPGLSDLDLLVVTDVARPDNEQYFSYRERLPQRDFPLFLHEPFILPARVLNVMRYTSHDRRALVAGKDILAGVSSEEGDHERWCRLLEGYCNYRSFADTIVNRAIMRGRHAVAVASSMRFTLRHADCVLGTALATPYASSIDAIRARFFKHDPYDAVLEVWEIFMEAFGALEKALAERLSLSRGEHCEQFARRFFSGLVSVSGVDPAYVQERNAAIERYHRALASLQVSYGHLFFLAAHVGMPRFAQPRWHGRAYHARYRLERFFGIANI